ncbi:MAG TPA: hypothetical protein VNG51_10135 [Ktedonobacteraceae bacterium]|nr:hypothetical protein [Ktedonobacteraceae bacterium]
MNTSDYNRVLRLLRKTFAISAVLEALIALLGYSMLLVHTHLVASVQVQCQFYSTCVQARERHLGISSWGVSVIYIGLSGVTMSLTCLLVSLFSRYENRTA